MEISELISYFIALLVVCNPLSALPALINLTQGKSPQSKKKIAGTASFAVAVILVAVTWIGGPVLNLFGIKVPAFQLAGGCVMLLVAFSMLNAQISRIKQTEEDEKEAEHKPSIAVVPLAMPIIAGPGAISTVIVMVSNTASWTNQIYLSFCGVLVAVCIWAVLYFAYPIEKMLQHTGINIVTRIGGLILASIAIQSIFRGISGLVQLFQW